MDAFLAAPETIYLLYIGIALGVFGLFTGIAQLVSRRENLVEARSRRLRMLAAGASTEEILAVLKPAEHGGLLTRLPLVGDLPRLIRRSGIHTSPTQILLLSVFIALLVMVPVTVFVSPLVGVAAGFALGFGIPILVLRSRAESRAEAMTGQLPDALDLLARGLRVGHPLNTSIQAVGTDMPDPIGSEFGVMFDQISYGDDLVDAFREFAERVDLEDVHYLAASIGIQHGTGGDLARIVQVLSQVIRGRIAMRRRILAISSEGRLSGNFLSLLPVFIFAATSVMSPDYYGGVVDDPMFKPIAVSIVLLTLLNFLAIRKLVNFRI